MDQSSHHETLRSHRLQKALALIALLVLGFLSSLFFSSIPIKIISQQLEREYPNIRFSQPSGSLNQGFLFEEVKYQSSEMTVSFKQLQLKPRSWLSHSGLLSLKNGMLSISELSAQEVYIEAEPRQISSAHVSLAIAIKTLSIDKLFIKTNHADSATDKSLGPFSVQVDDVALKPNQSSANIEGSFLGKIDFSSGSIKITSSLFDLSADGLTYQSSRPSFIGKLSGLLKPQWIPELIRVPIDFSIVRKGDSSSDGASSATLHQVTDSTVMNQNQFILTAFQGGLNLTNTEQGVSGTVLNLTPSHYFLTDLPIWNINLKVSNFQMQKPNLVQVTGQGNLRNKKFDLFNNKISHFKDGTKFELRLLPPLPYAPVFWKPGLKKGFMDADRPWWHRIYAFLPRLQIQSPAAPNAVEFLARLYFGQKLEKLTSDQKKYVLSDAQFFTVNPENSR